MCQHFLYMLLLTFQSTVVTMHTTCCNIKQVRKCAHSVTLLQHSPIIAPRLQICDYFQGEHWKCILNMAFHVYTTNCKQFLHMSATELHMTVIYIFVNVKI